MYKHIIESIDQVIKTSKLKSDTTTERDEHFFIQGLEVSKQVIEQIEELDITETAYETFEELAGKFSEVLEPEQFLEIIKPIVAKLETELSK